MNAHGPLRCCHGLQFQTHSSKAKSQQKLKSNKWNVDGDVALCTRVLLAEKCKDAFTIVSGAQLNIY